MPTSKAISASKLLGKDRYEYYLNELLTENTLGGQKLSNAQKKEAFKKRTNKISFEKFVDSIISTKTIKAAIGSPGTVPGPFSGAGGLGPKTGPLIKAPSSAIQKYIETQKTSIVGDQKDTGNIGDYLKEITSSLGNIIKILNQGISADVKNQQQKRRDRERAKREGVEKGLEKGFAAVSKVVDKVVAPVKSILSRIIDFFLKMFLARAVVKLIDWLADKNNQEKIQSLIRFFGDNWTKLLSLYIVFGTSFGKFARGLISLVIRGTAGLVKATAGLAAKVIGGKLGGKLGKAAKFIGGGRGKLIVAGIEAAATIGGTLALSKGIENFEGIGGGETQKFSGGGLVIPRFSGGGFNFKGMLGGAGKGAMFGPLGMLLGGALGGSSGFVSGPGGPKDDKVPAMLSDGEFVMSAGAVQKYGVDTFEAMNAAGGGTNKPRVVNGTTYAAGGGFVGDAPQSSNFSGRLNQLESILDNLIVDNKLRLRETGFNLGFRSAPENRMLPPAGQSSANAMRTSQKTARVARAPIPASRAIVPYANVGQKSTVSAKPVQRIYTNMNVPGGPTSSLSTRVRPRGYGGALQAAFAAMEFNDRKQAGQTTTQAGLGAAGSTLGGQVGWMAGAKAGALLGGAIGAMFGGVGAAPGAAVGAIVGGIAGGFGGASLGGKLADDVSGVNAAKERLSRGGAGGALKGGYGLKKQEFKDAPKTMVMTDDKGRPFVGHKAMKNGKLTYVRPSKPGTGTTNPLEALGRMINPGAYKENDQRLAMQKQKIAMVNALESFQAQGMAPDAQARMMKQMGGNLKDVQNDLNYRKKTQAQIAKTKPSGARAPVNPPTKPKPKVTVVAGGGMGGRRGSGVRSNTTGVPGVKASHPQGTRRNQGVLGIRK